MANVKLFTKEPMYDHDRYRDITTYRLLQKYLPDKDKYKSRFDFYVEFKSEHTNNEWWRFFIFNTAARYNIPNEPSPYSIDIPISIYEKYIGKRTMDEESMEVIYTGRVSTKFITTDIS